MQLMPSTAKFISKNKKISKNNSNILKEPLLNIEIGLDYIDYLLKLKIVDNNLVYMAAAYNAGPGNLKKWLNEINHNNDSLLFMESIPSRETRWFMEKILTNYWLYKNQFNEDVISLNLYLRFTPSKSDPCATIRSSIARPFDAAVISVCTPAIPVDCTVETSYRALPVDPP